MVEEVDANPDVIFEGKVKYRRYIDYQSSQISTSLLRTVFG